MSKITKLKNESNYIGLREKFLKSNNLLKLFDEGVITDEGHYVRKEIYKRVKKHCTYELDRNDYMSKAKKYCKNLLIIKHKIEKDIEGTIIYVYDLNKGCVITFNSILHCHDNYDDEIGTKICLSKLSKYIVGHIKLNE